MHFYEFAYEIHLFQFCFSLPQRTSVRGPIDVWQIWFKGLECQIHVCQPASKKSCHVKSLQCQTNQTNPLRWLLYEQIPSLKNCQTMIAANRPAGVEVSEGNTHISWEGNLPIELLKGPAQSTCNNHNHNHNKHRTPQRNKHKRTNNQHRTNHKQQTTTTIKTHTTNAEQQRQEQQRQQQQPPPPPPQQQQQQRRQNDGNHSNNKEQGTRNKEQPQPKQGNKHYRAYYHKLPRTTTYYHVLPRTTCTTRYYSLCTTTYYYTY